jgi:acetoin utilization protein AcuB
MVAKDLISLDIQPVFPDMTGKDAFRMQSDYHVKHLPVVTREGKLMGVISEDDIFNHKLYEAISEYDFSDIRKSSVQVDDHLFEVLRVMGESDLTLIPVTDPVGNYQGSVTLDQVVKHLSNTASIAEDGGIIVMDMPSRDYSLTDIARIVEAEDTKIISATITSNQSDELLEVTIKLNRPDVMRVVASLERHGYLIKEMHVEDTYQDNTKDRYDALMRYLDV